MSMSGEQHRSELRIATWTLDRIASAVGGELVGDSGELRVRRVSTDTRDLDDGALFVALVGERFDAHDFLEEAFDEGATAAIVHRRDAVDHGESPVIVVDDTLEALQALGRAIWDEATAEGLRTCSLTGSNGKTTVKEMAATLFARLGPTFATPGNLNNHVGVPLTLCALPLGTEYLVVEMGANAVGDIEELIAMAPGQTRIITSIGAAHLEGFGGMDGVRRGKSEIFLGGRDTDTAIVPDQERDRLVLDDFPGRVMTVGSDEDAGVRIVDFDPRGGRPQATYDVCGNTVTAQLPIPGRHQALNLGTALAATVAEGAELTGDDIQSALDTLALPGGRWREERVGDILFIDDAYNANPTSTVASFDAFMQIEDARQRVAVIGEMLELGDGAREQHVEVARSIAEAVGLAAFIAVGPHAEAMASAAAEEAEAQAFDTADAAGRWLAQRASQVDGLLVFLKGSRGARLEDVIERARGELEGSDDNQATEH
jgi:UDP-N-acetylmuramoyl-tripeptide--D-alanyl-D-alanine ligase